ncbi:MAG: ATP-binding protein [Candidatus Altiarchaeota archaeon]
MTKEPAKKRGGGGFALLVLGIVLVAYYSNTSFRVNILSDLSVLNDKISTALGYQVEIRYLSIAGAVLVFMTWFFYYRDIMRDLPRKERDSDARKDTVSDTVKKEADVKDNAGEGGSAREKTVSTAGKVDAPKKAVKPSLQDMSGKRRDDATPKLEFSAVTFKNVAGLNELKELLEEEVIYPMQHSELARQYKQRVGSGVLLYGPPGCGKTYVAEAIAGEIGWPIINASCGNLIGRYSGQTENNIHNVFEEARRQAGKLGGVIIFFDEIDALGLKRTRISEGSNWRQIVVNTLLSEFDGISANQNVFIIGATNAPWDVEPALKRTGRFNDCVFVPPPDEETRTALFRMYSEGLPLEEDIDYKLLAEKTKNYASSDIAEICDAAAEFPWKEAIKKGEPRKVNMKDFEKAIEKRKSSLQEWYAIINDMKLNKEFKKIFPDIESSVKEFCRETREDKVEGYR